MTVEGQVSGCPHGWIVSLKVIASFSALHFALPSIPFIILHSLVRSVFWSMVSTTLYFAVYALRCVSGCLYSVLPVQEVVSLCRGHLVWSLRPYLCWYMLLMESVASSRDVLRC